MPSIESDLGFAPQDLQWILSAYALTYGGLLLLGGRGADLLGRRRVFMAGLGLFALASLVFTALITLRPATSRTDADQTESATAAI